MSSRPDSAANAPTVTCVGDEKGFVGLREDWNALAADRSIFLQHEWFDAAWQWRRLEHAPRMAVFCVFRGERLIGVLPLLQRLERSPLMPRRILEFLTVPDTQFCDLLAAEGQHSVVAEALAGELAARRGDWDAIHLTYLSDQTLVQRELLPALARHGIAAELSASGGNPYVSLEAEWAGYYADRSRSLKKACNLAANRLAKAGNVRIDWLAPGTGDAAASSILEAAVAVSAGSWKRTTGKALDQPGPHAFFHRLSELALGRGWLSVWTLTLDGRAIATEIQLIFAGRVHALRSDFLQEHEELSPGTHLNRHLLEQLFGRGLHRYLMGPGDNPYKKRWTDQEESIFRLDAYSPSARGRTAALWDLKLKPALRRLKIALSQRRGSNEK